LLLLLSESRVEIFALPRNCGSLLFVLRTARVLPLLHRLESFYCGIQHRFARDWPPLQPHHKPRIVKQEFGSSRRPAVKRVWWITAILLIAAFIAIYFYAAH
jgi:hypothetical protein